MIQFIMPFRLRAELKEMGWAGTADRYSLDIDQLVRFVEKYGLDSASPVDLREEYSYTPEEIQILLDTNTAADVARAARMSPRAMSEYIKQHGLVTRRERLAMERRAEMAEQKKVPAKSTVPSKEELEPLLKEYTLADIADMFGVHPQTVTRWVKIRGLKSRRTRELEEKHKYNFKEMLLDRSLIEVSEETGIPVDTILKSL